MSVQGIVGCKWLTTIHAGHTNVRNMVPLDVPCYICSSVWLVGALSAAKWDLVQLHDFSKHNLSHFMITGSCRIEQIYFRAKSKLILYICVLCLCVFSVLPWLDKLSDMHCTEHQKRRHDVTQCGCACFCYFGNCSCILCTWNQNLQCPPPSWPWSNNRAPQKSLNQIKVY